MILWNVKLKICNILLFDPRQQDCFIPNDNGKLALKFEHSTDKESISDSKGNDKHFDSWKKRVLF